jgi:hypothetical protein
MVLDYKWELGWVLVDYEAEWLYLASLIAYCECSVVSVDDQAGTIELDAPANIDELISVNHDKLLAPPVASP